MGITTERNVQGMDITCERSVHGMTITSGYIVVHISQSFTFKEVPPTLLWLISKQALQSSCELLSRKI